MSKIKYSALLLLFFFFSCTSTYRAVIDNASQQEITVKLSYTLKVIGGTALHQKDHKRCMKRFGKDFLILDSAKARKGKFEDGFFPKKFQHNTKEKYFEITVLSGKALVVDISRGDYYCMKKFTRLHIKTAVGEMVFTGKEIPKAFNTESNQVLFLTVR